MKKRRNQRLEEITDTTLIVGVDIAKTEHWARFVDYRGIEIGKAISFKNDREGFESIVARIEEICKAKTLRHPIDNILIGMEPTGHYWKALANYFPEDRFKVVGVNPYHTKKAKELDDNSPTKSDKKDALVIARLVSEGRYFVPYQPQDVFSELRVLTNARVSVLKHSSATRNNIIGMLDMYFPEMCIVFKKPIDGKASRQILKNCPFPKHILEKGEKGVLAEIKKAVKKSVGIKRVKQLINIAQSSIGVNYGISAAKLRMRILIEEMEQYEKHISEIEAEMEKALKATGYSEQMLSIKGIGVVTAASFLGEVGDPLRFQNARQIANYAGYDLIEDSSGKNKSGTCISKRGRGQLRSLLYQMSWTMIGVNKEMKLLYKYLRTRTKNPLKHKQALVVISKKITTIIYSLLKRQAFYDSELVLGTVRRAMMAAA